MDAAVLARGMSLWTGWGSRSHPTLDDEAVIDAFGDADGQEVLAQLAELRSEFYATDAHTAAISLAALGDRAADEFRAKHPDVPDDVVAALRWCYTYDYR